MIKAIIFDCFGVLVGTGFNDTYYHAGGDPHKDKQFINDLLNKANLGLISEAGFKEAISRKIGITTGVYDKAVSEAERLNRDLLNYILKLRPKYKTAVLSNANLGVLERYLGEDLLDRSFDERIVSAEVGVLKPDPEIYNLTAQKLGVKNEECVFIDDTPHYVQAARAVGMQAIVYKDFVQMKTDLEKLLS